MGRGPVVEHLDNAVPAGTLPPSARGLAAAPRLPFFPWPARAPLSHGGAARGPCPRRLRRARLPGGLGPGRPRGLLLFLGWRLTTLGLAVGRVVLGGGVLLARLVPRSIRRSAFGATSSRRVCRRRLSFGSRTMRAAAGGRSSSPKDQEMPWPLGDASCLHRTGARAGAVPLPAQPPGQARRGLAPARPLVRSWPLFPGPQLPGERAGALPAPAHPPGLGPIPWPRQ